jgi:excisionase family DNA binding protein
MQALLTIAEASRLLKLSKTKLYIERKEGRLNVVTFGRSVRITEAELKRYVRAAAAGAGVDQVNRAGVDQVDRAA